MALELQKLESDRRLPRIARPPIPAGLEWLREAYGEPISGKAHQELGAAPQLDQTNIQALGCFLHALALNIQHLQAEKDAVKGRLLVWISRRWAEHHFRVVVRLNPTSVRGQYRLSQALLLRGHFAEARSAAEAATNLAPDRRLFKHWLRLVKLAERWFYKPPPPSAERPNKRRRDQMRRGPGKGRNNQHHKPGVSGPADQHR